MPNIDTINLNGVDYSVKEKIIIAPNDKLKNTWYYTLGKFSIKRDLAYRNLGDTMIIGGGDYTCDVYMVVNWGVYTKTDLTFGVYVNHVMEHSCKHNNVFAEARYIHTADDENYYFEILFKKPLNYTGISIRSTQGLGYSFTAITDDYFKQGTLFDTAYSLTKALYDGSGNEITKTYAPLRHNQAISTITGLQTALDGKATTTALTNGLNGKANSSHTHAIANVDGLQAALDGKQPTGDYATKNEIPDVSDKVTKASAEDFYGLVNALSAGDNATIPSDSDYYVGQYGGGSKDTYHRRPMLNIWNYIKGKISSVLKLTDTKYQGAAYGIADFENRDKVIEVGYSSRALTKDEVGNVAVYGAKGTDYQEKIKDVPKDTFVDAIWENVQNKLNYSQGVYGIQVTKAGNTEKVNGYKIVVGSVGSDSNTIYFV